MVARVIIYTADPASTKERLKEQFGITDIVKSGESYWTHPAIHQPVAISEGFLPVGSQQNEIAGDSVIISVMPIGLYTVNTSNTGVYGMHNRNAALMIVEQDSRYTIKTNKMVYLERATCIDDKRSIPFDSLLNFVRYISLNEKLDTVNRIIATSRNIDFII